MDPRIEEAFKAGSSIGTANFAHFFIILLVAALTLFAMWVIKASFDSWLKGKDTLYEALKRSLKAVALLTVIIYMVTR